MTSLVICEYKHHSLYRGAGMVCPSCNREARTYKTAELESQVLRSFKLLVQACTMWLRFKCGG